MRIFVQRTIFLAWLFLATPAVPAAQDDILGEWITQDREAIVQVFRKGNRFFGKIVSLKHPCYGPEKVDGMAGNTRLDLENPDEVLRDRPLIGLEIVRDFAFVNGRWQGGTVYDPSNGKTYRGRISLDDGGRLALRGFVGISLFGRTSYWERSDGRIKSQFNRKQSDGACR